MAKEQQTLVVIKDGKANAVSSTSLPTGYGNALQDAIDVLQTQNMNFEARSQLQDYLFPRRIPFS